MRAFVTGVSGFVGSHIAEYLAARGAETFGFARNTGAPMLTCKRFFCGTLLDATALSEAIAESRPTHVFHCAATLGGASSAAVYETNVIGTANLMQAVAASGLRPVTVVAGSSAVYGRHERLPIAEDDPLRPMTDYGASKAAQEMVATAYFLGRGVPVIRVRAFNLVGPRQAPSLVTSSLARQIARAEAGGEPVLRVGNTTSRRDYTDVRDAARAHVLIAENGTPGDVYNVCSGESRPVSEALSVLVRESRVPVQVDVDPTRGSAVDIDDQFGSYERLRQATGWTPRIAFEQSLRDLLGYWRAQVPLEKDSA